MIMKLCNSNCHSIPTSSWPDFTSLKMLCILSLRLKFLKSLERTELHRCNEIAKHLKFCFATLKIPSKSDKGFDLSCPAKV